MLITAAPAKNTQGWRAHGRRGKWGSWRLQLPGRKRDRRGRAFPKPSSPSGAPLPAEAQSPCSPRSEPEIPTSPSGGRPGCSPRSSQATRGRGRGRGRSRWQRPPNSGFRPPVLQAVPDGASGGRRCGHLAPDPCRPRSRVRGPAGSNPTGGRRQSTEQRGVLGTAASAGAEGWCRSARLGGLGPLHQSRRHTATQSQGCTAARRLPARASAKK